MFGRRVGGAVLTGVLVMVAGVVLLAPVAGAKPDRRRTVEVEARDNEFDAERLTVRTGTRIRFVNVGRNDHDVIPSSKDDEFLRIPRRRLEPDESARIRMKEPGRYRYYCSLHGTRAAGMRGVITVKG